MKTLTSRELQIADLIHQGYVEKEIACKLFLSPETVHTYKKRLFVKLQARNIADVTRIYILELQQPHMVIMMLFSLTLQILVMLQEGYAMVRPSKISARLVSVRTNCKAKAGKTFKFKAA